MSRKILILAVGQALFTAAISIDLTLTSLTGYQLAPDKSLSTLPFALITISGGLVTIFASITMQKIGRRWGFALGASTCAVGGLISVWAVFHGDFWLFCLGTASVGVFQAFAQYYRLAAADGVESSEKAKAISTVLAGSVVAAVLGPMLAAWSKNLFSVLFTGSYFMVFMLGALTAVIFAFGYRDAPTHAAALLASPLPRRPMPHILRQPVCLAAIANTAIGSAAMMLVMTGAPLAAVECGHSIDDGANIIQWHLVGMYAPSLFAGRVIGKYGLSPVLFSGMALILISSLIAVVSTSLSVFYVALLCLGVGWNFMFVGGSALLVLAHRDSERAQVQGIAEALRYGLTAIATLAAGPALELGGWAVLNLANIPLMAITAILTGLWFRSQRTAARTDCA